MKTTLVIQNLKCSGCANTITTELQTINQITNIEVDPENNSVSFLHVDQDDINLAETLLGKLGYPVIGNFNSFRTKTKSYMSCAMGKFKD